jgi:hypothetical protein
MLWIALTFIFAIVFMTLLHYLYDFLIHYYTVPIVHNVNLDNLYVYGEIKKTVLEEKILEQEQEKEQEQEQEQRVEFVEKQEKEQEQEQETVILNQDDMKDELKQYLNEIQMLKNLKKK